MFVNLDKPTPLIRIDENDLAAVLIANGIDVRGSVFGEDDEPEHQRVSILAIKEAPATKLFIPTTL